MPFPPKKPAPFAAPAKPGAKAAKPPMKKAPAKKGAKRGG